MLLRLHGFFCVLLLSLLIGCTPQPKTRSLTQTRKTSLGFPHHFEVVGKIGISDGTRGTTVNLRWQQEGMHYTADLSGPLGTHHVRVNGNQNNITVTRADGQILIAKTAEEIIATEFGWMIPVSGLHYWLRGMPEPQQPIEQREVDTLKRLTLLKQDGWSIVYNTYQNVDGIEVPHKMTLFRPPLQLHCILQRWYFK